MAIVFGLVTAVLWAGTLLGSARSARLIGAWSTLAWVMLIGLVITLPLVLAGPPVSLSTEDLLHLLLAGVGNTGGLLLVYTALRRGKVAVVGPIVSTEGAIGATLAILAGDPVTAGTIALLALIAVGVAMAAAERAVDESSAAVDEQASPRVTALIAIAGALLFGVSLYAMSRIAGDLPVAWVALPARLIGTVAVSLPLILSRRIRLTRAAAPFVVFVAVAEVLGVVTFALGARDSAPVTSVLASQFAAIAAVAAYFLYGERLSRVQVVGVATIAVGVALLAALQAA
jgi:drug/metabolite transporter (DMT)-like permease